MTFLRKVHRKIIQEDVKQSPTKCERFLSRDEATHGMVTPSNTIRSGTGKVTLLIEPGFSAPLTCDEVNLDPRLYTY